MSFLLYYTKLKFISCVININELSFELIKDVITEDIKNKVHNFNTIKQYCILHNLDYELTIEDIKKLLDEELSYRVKEIVKSYYKALKYTKFAPLHTIN
jgi:GTP cyclohydrolase FolE2